MQQDLPRLLLKLIGHAARCDDLAYMALEQYTAQLPAALRKLILVRGGNFSSSERRAALKAAIEDRGLSTAYAEIAPLWASLTKYRNEIAHRHIVPSPKSSDQVQLVSLSPIAEQQIIIWTRGNIVYLLLSWERLEGLITSFLIEIGALSVVTNGGEMVSGPELLGNPSPDERRKPWTGLDGPSLPELPIP